MRVSRLLITLAVAALSVVDAHADVIDYTATFDSITGHFFPDGLGSGTHWTILHLEGSTPELTGTLDAGQQLRMTYSAPAGQQINILQKPASADSLVVVADLWSEPSLSSPLIDASGASYTFTGLTGTDPTVSAFDFNGGAGDAFRARLHFNSGSFSFQSLEMLFDIPAGYDRTFVDHVPEGVRLLVIASWSWPNVASDPGPLATITPVAPDIPEPSMLLLSATVGIVSAWRRRRARTTPST